MDLLRKYNIFVKKYLNKQKKTPFSSILCTAPQKLDIKNLTFGVFFNEINL